MLSFRESARRLALGALVLTTALTAACDDGDEASIRSQKCDEICAYYEMCDDATDETGCQDKCAAESFRSDTYFKIKADCVTGLACNRLEDRDDSADLSDCVRRAFRDEDTSEEADMLCTSLSNKISDCDSEIERETVLNECEPVAMTLSDDYLSASQTCAGELCANVEKCLENLADDYDTNVKVFSGDIDPGN